MRSVTANWQTAAANKGGSAPYFVLEIAWTTGTKYYMDRATGTFANADGYRHPVTIQAPLVLDWGDTTLELRENQVGGRETRSITIDDASRAVTAILEGANQQRVAAKIWRMFDDPNVLWGTDNLLVWSGSLTPFSWSIADNVVTLRMEDSGPRLLKSVSHTATAEIFEDIPESYRDRHIPNCIGRSERVEAILVSAPWEATLLEPIPAGTGDYTAQIQEHPDDIGAPTGVTIEVFLDGDLVSGYFTQSATPDTTPSTFTITSPQNYLWRFAVGHVDGTGTSRRAITAEIWIEPAYLRPTFATEAVGKTVDVYVIGFVGSAYIQEWVTATIATITTGTPWPSAIKITFDDSDLNESMSVGCIGKVRDSASGRRMYEAGSKIRPKDAEWIYVANNLPSKGVIKVEGWGDIRDEAGPGRKDFILIGQLIQDELSGSIEVEDNVVDPFTVNLNDNTWNLTGGAGEGTAADLGHNVTTITFRTAPRELKPGMEDNRIWVTLLGAEDERDSTGDLITNPVLAILEYLENPVLCGVDASDIDAAAFTTAAADSDLSSRRVGFAQIEPMNGIDIVQEMARQCHCVLFFDLGQVTIQVLKNTAPASTSLTLDTSSADNIVQDTLEKSDSDVDDLITHVVGRWRAKWDDKTGHKHVDVVKASTGTEAVFGRRDVEYPIWIYYKRADVEAELSFWLTRWSRVYRHVNLTALQDAIKLQPADWITLSYSDASGNALFSSTKLEVLRTRDNGPEGTVDLEARFAAFSW